MRHLTRHQFLAALTAIGTGATLGCGSDSEDSGSGGTSGSAGSAGTGATGGSGGSGGSGASGGTGGSGATGGSAGTSGSGGSAGASGSGGSSGGSGCNVEITAQITCRHGHELIIPLADLQAGATKTYDIEGTASHSHEVEVTAEMFAKLQAGETVEIQVPSQFQPHKVVIHCSNPPSHLLDDTECN